MTTKEQNQVYEELCKLTGEQVADAFLNYHGMQLITDAFALGLVEDGVLDFDK